MYLPRLAVAAEFLTLILLLGLLSGCSVRKMAVNSLGDALAGGAGVYASDEDPELVRDALPFALKTIESLLAESPDHEALLTAAASGFTQYSYAFVETDAFLSESRDEVAHLEGRALKLYLRARDYGLRGLELGHPNFSVRLLRDPSGAVSEIGGDKVALLYWTGAAWGAAISLGQDRPELVADLDAVRALLGRALALEPDFDLGAIHQAFIAVESLPEMMGGSPLRAREHFEAAVELSEGLSAVPFVTMAATISVARQDLIEFRELLDRALEVDPDAAPNLRLSNRIAQRRAVVLRARAEELFIDFVPEIP